MRVRQYGTSGPLVILLHGGPGAGGYLTPLARALADPFRVIEPLQRRSGNEPLTVAVHVDDLDELVVRDCGGEPPALVGHSWGAMLALAYAAAHPDRVRALALIGCGTFDPAARDRMRAIIDERMDDELKRRIERLPEECPDPDERLRMLGNLMLPLYSYDAAASELDIEVCDSRAYDETWQDMLRLQREAVYPSAFAAIDAPVLMIHGAVDPHPGRLIRATLQPYLARLEFREWERCGHYPWLETGVRREFFGVLREWLSASSVGGARTQGMKSPKAGYMYVWEYLVAPNRIDAFEHTYGASGDWVQLFRRAPGYLRSELHRDRSNPLRFLTIDYWESQNAWEAFRSRFSEEFEALDARGGELTTRESEIGRFEPVE